MSAMFHGVIRSKFFAFVTSAFLCLNLSGSFCVAYCQVNDATAKAENCPLKKSEVEHCLKSKSALDKNGKYKSFKGNAFECCNLAINVFAAPLEKHQKSFQTAGILAQNIFFSHTVVFEKTIYKSNYSHQKPLRDSRTQRLKNCVFRI